MNHDVLEIPTTGLIEEIILLEDAYVYALLDNTDRLSLRNVWERIQALKTELLSRSGEDRHFEG